MFSDSRESVISHSVMESGSPFICFILLNWCCCQCGTNTSSNKSETESFFMEVYVFFAVGFQKVFSVCCEMW